MHHRGVSSVLVGDDPAGLASDRDLVRAMALGIDAEVTVSKVAAGDPVWAPWDLSIAEAASLMIHHEIRHLIVAGPNGNAIGVISVREAFLVMLRVTEPSLWASQFSLLARS